ncbi:hypothetical protein OQA88_7117 [Cercophora sp. LCS_1]
MPRRPRPSRRPVAPGSRRRRDLPSLRSCLPRGGMIWRPQRHILSRRALDDVVRNAIFALDIPIRRRDVQTFLSNMIDLAAEVAREQRVANADPAILGILEATWRRHPLGTVLTGRRFIDLFETIRHARSQFTQREIATGKTAQPGQVSEIARAIDRYQGELHPRLGLDELVLLFIALGISGDDDTTTANPASGLSSAQASEVEALCARLDAMVLENHAPETPEGGGGNMDESDGEAMDTSDSE